jgi:glycosyltransferase involved in cell wall biosynthesis
MADPLVTVIMASFNGERFLREALDSLFAQEYAPFEVVFVDDGSADGTAEIARTYDVRYLHQVNAGLAAARNTGMREARGELVTFLDDDDLMPPNRLRLQASFLQGHPDIACVLGRQEWIDAPPWLPRDPVFGDPAGIPFAAAMIRSEALEAVAGFDATVQYAEDRDLLIRLRENGFGIEVLPEIVLLRRYHGENMTAPSNRPEVHPLTRSLKGKLDRQRKASRADKLISVVIPAFNAEPYVGEAIESALAQTLAPSEVIVVNDGSTDGTESVVRRFGDTVRYERQERAGNGAARNRGVELSHGEYLAFLDADDRFVRDKLERQMNVLAGDPNVDVVFGHVREFISPELDPELAARLRRPAADAPWAAPNLMLIRRRSFERVGPFSADLKVGVTVDWYARALEAELNMVMPADVVLERRLHAENNGLRERDSRAQYLHVLKASLDRRRAQAARPTDKPSSP